MKKLIQKANRRVRRKKHVRKVVQGTPERPRMSVYKSSRHLYIQVIDDLSGKTIAYANNLEKDNKSIPSSVEGAAKLGELIGERLKEKKITNVVFDRNGYVYHGKVKAIADGARKSGITI
ncbi:MAG: 50S ribosomal protein L18 [Spirochaetales bacterium]|uniref:Large ribosomal subunit protein uL18 n=1 Tax=Candidatus Thalassospirochaeta sargassi TaxID=3119039 RepID=A0AAJ1IF66_9SPIO|nr:50S ribosomal protein L18 [Spirochaetales bacterium]